jgi:hypothetical protein
MLSSLDREGPIDERALAASMSQDGAPVEYREIRGPVLRRLPRRLSGPCLELMLRAGQRRTVAVPCTVKTVSQVLREAGQHVIDLLKVDVEGAELDVLRGIDEADWPKIRAVIAEVHDVDGRVDAVRRLLEDRGFDHVDVHQDWLFQMTNIHMISADRS